MNLAMRIFPNTTAYRTPQRNRVVVFVWREPASPARAALACHRIYPVIPGRERKRANPESRT
jgi:hypothetical protein